MASIDESSRQLWTDYIDLLLVHWPRVSAPLEAQIAGLNAAEQAGKARHIAVSNHNAAMFSVAVEDLLLSRIAVVCVE